MEKDCECYKEEVQPYRKTDYKPIIYIYIIYKKKVKCMRRNIDEERKEAGVYEGSESLKTWASIAKRLFRAGCKFQIIFYTIQFLLVK